jgi:hypothetical protein
VDAAVTMHCYNDQVISPRLKTIALPEVRFRVGIETGLVTIANVGVRGSSQSGCDRRRAEYRLQVAEPHSEWRNCPWRLYSPGDYTHHLLSGDWQRETTSIGPLPGYVLHGTTTPYPALEVEISSPQSRKLGVRHLRDARRNMNGHRYDELEE